MSEEIYILSENGNICGLKDREEVHQNGILHAGVQCWLMNTKGEVLLQKRSTAKDHSGGKWDVSCGGHCVMTAGATDVYSANMVKEGREELGITVDPDKLIKLGSARYTSQNGKNREILQVYLLPVAEDIALEFADGEVTAVKWMLPEDVCRNIMHNRAEYANRTVAIDLLLKYLQSGDGCNIF